MRVQEKANCVKLTARPSSLAQKPHALHRWIRLVLGRSRVLGSRKTIVDGFPWRRDASS